MRIISQPADGTEAFRSLRLFRVFVIFFLVAAGTKSWACPPISRVPTTKNTFYKYNYCGDLKNVNLVKPPRGIHFSVTYIKDTKETEVNEFLRVENLRLLYKFSETENFAVVTKDNLTCGALKSLYEKLDKKYKSFKVEERIPGPCSDNEPITSFDKTKLKLPARGRLMRMSVMKAPGVKSCQTDDDCMLASCDCICGNRGHFQVINKKFQDEYFRQSDCETIKSCPEWVCPKINVSCKRSRCAAIIEKDPGFHD